MKKGHGLRVGVAASILLCAVVALGWFGHRRHWMARKIVLITIDTLRADRLGFYGYRERATSPNLDAWAREAVVFERVNAQAPWTVPSLGSLLTGRYPVEAGVYTNTTGLRADLVTLPEVFRRNGFKTASFNTHALLLGEEGGFRRGFDEVFPDMVETVEAGEHKIPFSRTEPDLMRWLDEHGRDDRFFVWIHDMDPHHPPTPGNPLIEEEGWDLYDAEVRWVDEAVGRIIMKLQALDIWDESLVIFTADHGEAFEEHGIIGHQNVMYEEVLRVPLIIQYPEMGPRRRIEEPVELLDLFLTIVELAGVPPPPRCRGESLVPLLEGKGQQLGSELSFNARYYFEDGHHELAVRDRRWKLIVRTPGNADIGPDADPLPPPRWDIEEEGTSLELYQLVLDPQETRNVAEAYPEVSRRLQEALLEWEYSVARPVSQLAPQLDSATQEAARALGY